MDCKHKIFVSAYACEPGLGSEIGVGWHWILEMSRYFELWVLTRESNRHTIEPWIALQQEYANIHFLYFDLPKWARFWKKGLRGVRTYYNIWQACTNSIVKRTMQKENIKIFHHLTYGNLLWKVSSYGQKQFFIWGPAGGLETIPTEYSRHYSMKARVVEWVRRTAIALLPMNFGFKRRCKNADIILCKTEITRNLIPAKNLDKTVLFTDVAVERQATDNNNVVCDDKGYVEFITVGHLDAWRGFDIVIESFAKAAQKNKNIHLTIVGNGGDKERLQKIATGMGVTDKITFTGKVSMQEYHRLLSVADVVVNASLKEGAVTVSFDSMAKGKPLICLDTTGYTRYFSNDYAIVIPRSSRPSVIEKMSNAMLCLTDDDTRKNLGEKAKNAGESFTWEARGREFRNLLLSKIQE